MRALALAALVAATLGCGKKSDPTATGLPDAGEKKAGGGTKTETLNRFQGTWTLMKLERPTDEQRPDLRAVTDPELRQVGITVTDGLLALDLGGRGDPMYYTLEPGQGEELDFVTADAPGPKPAASPRGDAPPHRFRHPARYKFDGETLVLVTAVIPDGKRPAEFKPGLQTLGPRQVPVVVAHLKKK